MDVLLGIVAGLAVAGCVWLLIGRGKLAARAARAEATAVAREGEAARLAGELGGANSKMEGLGGRCQSLSQQVLVLKQEHEAAAAAHEAELASIQALTNQQLKAVEERDRTFRQEQHQRDQAMREAFAALSAETLSKSTESFLSLAKQTFAVHQEKANSELEKRQTAVDGLIKPIADTLKKTDERLAAIDQARAETAASLAAQMQTAADASRMLREETGKLVRALREPHVRGRYGELQLRRVAGLAGVSAYCDFAEQASTLDGDRNPLRPDLIVKLPSERVVVVDAKTNIRAYLDALHASTPELAEACLDRFARHVSEQATALARKRYWSQYDGSPEFVVMFIPGDQFIDGARARQQELLENAPRAAV